MQPAELIIIGGAAIGTVLIGNPPYILKSIISSLLAVFKGSRYTATIYLDTLRFLNDFFGTSRKNGFTALENDLDEPDKSALFKRHPSFATDKEAMHFFCDTMRTLLAGGVEVHDLDQVMETDLEVLHKQARLPAAAISTMADSLPGLGIVAAVLGVVITMSALGVLRKKLDTKWLRRWWERFSAFFCATDFWGRWRPTSRNKPTRKASISSACAWACWRI